MRRFITYFDCGLVSQRADQAAVDYRVEKFLNLTNSIIPFLLAQPKYPILGVKSQDFEDFCRIADLMEQKKHLTKEELDKIRKIKSGMNKFRDNSVVS